MRDRHVRRIVLGLIFAFPMLITAMAPAPRGWEALVPLAAVEAILAAGLCGAYWARRGLLAAQEALACEPALGLAPAHFATDGIETRAEARVRR
jgi:hypothetical protein